MIIKVDKEIELKQIDHDDGIDIFNTINSQREYLGKWLPFVEYTKELSYTEEYIESVITAPEECFEYIFTIRKQGEFVGIAGFRDTDRLNKKTEIGYWLSENYQKQGIVTKTVQKLCDFAFDTLEMNRIQIRCALGNIPSKKIPQRLGFHFEGIERDGELLTGNVYTDLEVYSKLKRDKLQ